MSKSVKTSRKYAGGLAVRATDQVARIEPQFLSETAENRHTR
jgi:hypothetical protein